jgi:hypothetical protein
MASTSRRQLGALHRRRIVAVGDVVDFATEGVDGEHRLAPGLGQQTHRPIKRCAGRSDARADGGARIVGRLLERRAHV